MHPSGRRHRPNARREAQCGNAGGSRGNQLFTSIKFDRARATSATTGESRQMPQYQSARDSWVDEHSTRFNYYSVESGYVGLESKGGGMEKDPQWKRWETVSMGTSRAGSRHFKLMRQVVNISFYLGVNKSGKRRAALPTVINVRPFKRQASIAPLYHRRPNPVGCRPLLVAIVPSTSSSSYLGAFFTCFKYRHVRLLQILLKLISR